VDVFIETLVKMDTTDYEANRENSEAVAVHEETEVETVGVDEGDRRNSDRP
jgi:hypothetical protein